MRKLLSIFALMLACTVPAVADFQCGTPVTASFTGVAGAGNSASLPAVAGHTNYITGFEVTAAPVVTSVTGLLQVLNTPSTLNYQFNETVAGSQYFVQFNPPIPASAQNVAITVGLPTIAGGGVTAVVVHGCQL